MQSVVQRICICFDGAGVQVHPTWHCHIVHAQITGLLSFLQSGILSRHAAAKGSVSDMSIQLQVMQLMHRSWWKEMMGVNTAQDGTLPHDAGQLQARAHMSLLNGRTYFRRF